MTNAHLTHLSFLIADSGPSVAETDLVELARRARRRGVAVVAANVMTDRASPRVVRERAFAVVCAALTAAESASVAELAVAS